MNTATELKGDVPKDVGEREKEGEKCACCEFWFLRTTSTRDKLEHYDKEHPGFIETQMEARKRHQ